MSPVSGDPHTPPAAPPPANPPGPTVADWFAEDPSYGLIEGMHDHDTRDPKERAPKVVAVRRLVPIAAVCGAAILLIGIVVSVSLTGRSPAEKRAAAEARAHAVAVSTCRNLRAIHIVPAPTAPGRQQPTPTTSDASPSSSAATSIRSALRASSSTGPLKDAWSNLADAEDNLALMLRATAPDAAQIGAASAAVTAYSTTALGYCSYETALDQNLAPAPAAPRPSGSPS